MMPSWPVPADGETVGDYISITLVEHERAMAEWSAEYGHLFAPVAKPANARSLNLRERTTLKP